MTEPLCLPIDNPTFSEDKETLKRIKHLEDRIEQQYSCHEILTTITALADIYQPPTSEPSPSGCPEFLKPFITDNPKDTIDKDQGDIFRIQKEHGTLYVLALLSSELWQGLESLFAGALISYCKMFNSGSRLRLEPNKIFREHPLYLNQHNALMELRNKNFAHKDTLNDRHHLHYFVEEPDKISIDSCAPHKSYEYHLKELQPLINCMALTSKFIAKDIDEKKESLIDRLNAQQREVLLEHWKTFAS
ncbi:hypothetical protein [Salipiger sp.]|uniref:hypothetical protein n=1 Tax=Salipiger sp. TaxID=2078585 RepID=UPI003A97DBD4